MAGMHPRNIEAMLQHRKNLHVEAIQRTDAALDALERSGSAITFQLVARGAGVSRAWLYKQQDVRDRITALRRERPSPAHAPEERASQASKEAMIRALRQRLGEERTANMKMANENKQLRKINEVLAGQVHLCRTYHTTNAGVASDYSRIVYHAPPQFSEDSAKSEKCSPPEIRSLERSNEALGELPAPVNRS